MASPDSGVKTGRASRGHSILGAQAPVAAQDAGMGHGGRPRLLRVGPCVLDLQGGDLAGVRAEAGSLGRGPHHPGSSPREHASQSRAAWPSFGPYTPKSPPSSCWPVMGENYAGGCAGAEVPKSRQAGGKRDMGSMNSGASRGHSRVCAISNAENQAGPAGGCHRPCRSTKLAARLEGCT